MHVCADLHELGDGTSCTQLAPKILEFRVGKSPRGILQLGRYVVGRGLSRAARQNTSAP